MIEIKNISMHYGPVKAVDNVTFNVKKGEVFGLLGPNGAGKSTLMRILTTFIYPLSGTATMGEYDILTNPIRVREIVGYLPETAPLYTDMRVDEYLQFVGRARGLAGRKLSQRIAWVRKACAINPVWKHTIHEISKGFRQRVGLAQALIHDPEILILDEPTSGLDPLQIIEIRKLIRELSQEKTIIFSTHILQEVEALADRIVIINNGAIVSSGTQDELSAKAMKYRCHILTVQEPKDAVESALSGVRGAKEIRFIDHTPDGFTTFEIRSSFENDEVWKEIDRTVRDNKWTVKKFTEQAYNLEDTFISLLTAQKSKSNSKSTNEV